MQKRFFVMAAAGSSGRSGLEAIRAMITAVENPELLTFKQTAHPQVETACHCLCQVFKMDPGHGPFNKGQLIEKKWVYAEDVDSVLEAFRRKGPLFYAFAEQHKLVFRYKFQ